MRTVLERLRGLRAIAGPLLGALVVLYFAYHTVHGERGFFAWLSVKDKVAEKRVALAKARAVEAFWGRRVRQLEKGGLRTDMLDEQARRMLNLARPDELVILTGRSGDAATAGADR